MTDEEFIDKLNDIFINYGYIILNMKNTHYHFNKYKIQSRFRKCNTYETYMKFVIYNIKKDELRFGFENINDIINDREFNWSIFKCVELDKISKTEWFSDEFRNFILSIKGNSAEEILLKLQMMGY